VEKTDVLVADLLRESGADAHDDSAFKYLLRFRDRSTEVKASVGTRWCPHSLPSSAEERRMRRPWIVFAIVDAPGDYAILKMDSGTRHRAGDGWRIAARVPVADVVEVREFPPPQGGPLVFIRPRRP
jgi:hypothetical protein